MVDLTTLVDHPKSTFFDMTNFLKFGRMWPESAGMVLDMFWNVT